MIERKSAREQSSTAVVRTWAMGYSAPRAGAA